MSDFPKDIYTEPFSVDVNTLANLGPLRAMAGVWEGMRGISRRSGPGVRRSRPAREEMPRRTLPRWPRRGLRRRPRRRG